MTPLCFLDTETTSLRPDRRAWDVALIRRDDGGERDAQFFIDLADLDLGDADPFSLQVGRFWDLHPQADSILRRGLSSREYAVADEWSGHGLVAHSGSVVSAGFAAETVAHYTHGAHIVGAVPSFDAEVLAALLRYNGVIPAWHHHLIDVETLAVGHLAGRGETLAPPWKSDDQTLARAEEGR